MWCIKCNGRIFVDRVFSQKLIMELYCIMCGNRWMIKRDSRFGAWLSRREEKLQKSFGISI